MKHALYNQLAGYYDLIYSRKDYKGESKRLRKIIRENGKSSGNRLLEVACGTGRYLEHLEEYFSCTGVDLSPAMLRIARKRLVETTLKRADMRAFDLGQQFDVVLCLFSSIANLKNSRELQQTMKNFSRHMNPGGLLILEPYLHADEFRQTESRLFTYDSPGLKVARIDVPKRRGNKTILDFHWLIGEKGKHVKYISHDYHELTVFSNQQYVESLRLAGLKPRFLEADESAGGPLYLGIKPEE